MGNQYYEQKIEWFDVIIKSQFLFMGIWNSRLRGRVTYLSLLSVKLYIYIYIYNRNSTETCVKLSPRNLNPDPYPSTPHKYLYLWSDHRANGVRLWPGFVIWFWVAFMAVRFWFLRLWMVVVVILCAFFFFFFWHDELRFVEIVVIGGCNCGC